MTSGLMISLIIFFLVFFILNTIGKRLALKTNDVLLFRTRPWLKRSRFTREFIFVSMSSRGSVCHVAGELKIAKRVNGYPYLTATTAFARHTIPTRVQRKWLKAHFWRVVQFRPFLLFQTLVGFSFKPSSSYSIHSTFKLKNRFNKFGWIF